MSELVLTLLRWGILIALWLFVMFTLGALRRDLEARPRGVGGPAPSATASAAQAAAGVAQARQQPRGD